MRAALGDLRHLQHFLGQVVAQRDDLPVDHDLIALAEREVSVLREVGDRIQQALKGKL